MALIECPECLSKVSDKAAACPKCGHPIQRAAAPPAAAPQPVLAQPPPPRHEQASPQYGQPAQSGQQASGYGQPAAPQYAAPPQQPSHVQQQPPGYGGPPSQQQGHVPPGGVPAQGYPPTGYPPQPPPAKPGMGTARLAAILGAAILGIGILVVGYLQLTRPRLRDDAPSVGAPAAAAQAAQAQAEAEGARAAAEAERLALAKREAPNLVSVTAAGCRCANGHTIVVSCSVQNGAQVPVTVSLTAASETGGLGISARGNGPSAFRLAPGQDVVKEVTTYFSGLMDCSSCSASKCRGSVEAP